MVVILNLLSYWDDCKIMFERIVDEHIVFKKTCEHTVTDTVVNELNTFPNDNLNIFCNIEHNI